MGVISYFHYRMGVRMGRLQAQLEHQSEARGAAPDVKAIEIAVAESVRLAMSTASLQMLKKMNLNPVRLARRESSRTSNLRQSVIGDPEMGAVIVVDPLSTGAVLAKYFCDRNFEVVRLFSQKFPERLANFILPELKASISYIYSFEFTGGSFTDLSEEQFQAECDAVVLKIRSMHVPVQAVIAGAETGVEVCDAVAQRLGLPNNGPSMSHVRRDKFLMGEQVRSAGIRAVQQARVTTWEEVELFLDKAKFSPFKCVIKPLASAGSDGVSLCTSREELKERFDTLYGATNVLGLKNNALVLQEYLEGKEYVVDTVSRFGHHKVCAIWEYDKRPCNGAAFVYYGMRLLSGNSKVAQQLTHYMKSVLDALNIVNSPGHGEVILTKTGPCLVEVGARPHGGEGIWTDMVDKCLGYSQVSVTMLALTDPVRFRAIPDIPILKGWNAMEVMFISRAEGVLQALPKLPLIEKLTSFHRLHLECRIGEKMLVTTDYLSTPGSVILIHQSKTQLEADFEAIRELEMEGFFVLDATQHEVA